MARVVRFPGYHPIKVLSPSSDRIPRYHGTALSPFVRGKYIIKPALPSNVEILKKPLNTMQVILRDTRISDRTKNSSSTDSLNLAKANNLSTRMESNTSMADYNLNVRENTFNVITDQEYPAEVKGIGEVLVRKNDENKQSGPGGEMVQVSNTIRDVIHQENQFSSTEQFPSLDLQSSDYPLQQLQEMVVKTSIPPNLKDSASSSMSLTTLSKDDKLQGSGYGTIESINVLSDSPKYGPNNGDALTAVKQMYLKPLMRPAECAVNNFNRQNSSQLISDILEQESTSDDSVDILHLSIDSDISSTSGTCINKSLLINKKVDKNDPFKH